MAGFFIQLPTWSSSIQLLEISLDFVG
ncbi:hypothetical protein MTR67_000744 [Solanum verrucosum]|uniref:Uncharacterized protein n=1 Tax=Solanum verrucosum TaxID=315347 RepID=A0AAF0T792_SOLVR|nr:hypothetical protein MTR67_000744 [Solanum verrucosum]